MPGAGAAVAPRRVVVLGIGNTLLADEGVGVHAALALQQDWRLPDGVEVIDGGTAGMELLGPLAGADLLQMVEGGLAGTDYRVTAWVTLSDTQQRALPAILPVRDIT